MRICLLLVLCALCAVQCRWFGVQNNSYVRDGERIVLRSGSMHYFRVVPELWWDRLERMSALGLNAVQTYVPWNFHEVADGSWLFAGDRDIVKFIQLAHKAGLLVLLRIGPYICAEYDFGGLPPYLLTIPGIELRTNNTQYLQRVERWFSQLLFQIRPLLYSNGGPVIMVQVENEYGSYGDTQTPADHAYMLRLREIISTELGGDDVLLYTTDGGTNDYLSRGSLPGIIFATGDNGPTVFPQSMFDAEDAHNPEGWRVHVNSEYYTGWLTHWGENMANTSSLDTATGLTVFMTRNASFNLYMAHGGTNFGFCNGANGGGTAFQPVITSYDYDCPISEGGGHGFGPDGDKYRAIRHVLEYWHGPLPSEPSAPPAAAYGTTELTEYVALLGNEKLFAETITTSEHGPRTMESYGQSEGYIIYRTVVPSCPKHDVQLNITGVADRAEVFLAGRSLGVSYRPAQRNFTVPVKQCQEGAFMDILVENMGHINYGRQFFDPKGIIGSVQWDGHFLTSNYTVFTLPFNYADFIRRVSFESRHNRKQGPAMFRGTLKLNTVSDTYLALCGWQKGVVWINGFHLGRYWEPVGPQHTLYVPAPILRSGANEIVVFEQHSSNADATVRFVSTPDFTGAVCNSTVPATSELSDDDDDTVAVAQHVSVSCRAMEVGLNLSLAPCNLLAETSFKYEEVYPDSGRFILKANPKLCIGLAHSNATAGTADLVLVPCNSHDHTQSFFSFHYLTSRALVSATSGLCTTSDDSKKDFIPVQLRPCSQDAAGQSWTVDKAHHQIINNTSKMCIAAC